eukprot:m51a1_g3274 putative megakaryocyte-associated tyrosine-protein kinase (370) ;mRNA; f:235976-237438
MRATRNEMPRSWCSDSDVGAPGPVNHRRDERSRTPSASREAASLTAQAAATGGLLDDVVAGEVIGTGTHGVVRRGVWLGTTDVALKSVAKDAPARLHEALAIEFSLLSVLRHPNIVTLYGLSIVEGELVLVQELASGSLLELLRSRGGLPPRVSLQAAVGIAAGMSYLAANNIVHRDLGCRNVLYSLSMTGSYGSSLSLMGSRQNKDGLGLLAPFSTKVSDFGMSRADAVTCSRAEPSSQPVRWMAPEALSGVWSEKTDVWSFGVVLWEIYSGGETPWGKRKSKQVREMVLNGARLTPPLRAPDAIACLMMRCWERDANIRPTFRELHGVLIEVLRNTPEDVTVDMQAEPAADLDFDSSLVDTYYVVQS